MRDGVANIRVSEEGELSVSDAALGSVRIGLHFAEAVAGARLLAAGCTREQILGELAALVPAPDEERRRRVASALVHRLLVDCETEDPARCPVVELLAAAGCTLDARHLLLYATARRERLVMAIAAEVFFPCFVLGRPPEGLSERDFAALNTGRLLETDQVITHRLVDEYARRRWGFDDPTSTQTALRILREGGALAATWLERGDGRCLGYFPSHRGPSRQTFVYALWEEFASRGRRTVPRVHLRGMALAHLFCLPGPVVEALGERAAEEGFCALDARRSGGPISVTHTSFAEATVELARQVRPPRPSPTPE